MAVCWRYRLPMRLSGHLAQRHNELYRVMARANAEVFRAGLLLPALVAHPNAADDSAAMERAGFCPLIVRGRADNIKITDAADLQLAAAILINRPQVADDKKPAH